MSDKWYSPHLPVASTFSKDPKMFGNDFTPRAITHSGCDGASIISSDGLRYLDWISALGANLCGYPTDRDGVKPADRIAYAAQEQVWQGAGFSLPHVLEAQVAERLVNKIGSRIPGWSADNLGVRFGKSGTDATTMAVRLARAVKGIKRVLSYGYHGWADWSVAATPPAWGATGRDYITDIEFNDLDSLSYWLHNGGPTAAVIMEVPMQESNAHYFAGVRELCDRNGALLILDEVVTGLRYAIGGASELYDIHPDLICLGKGIANGYAVSAIMGSKEYFDWFARVDPCFVSSTHFGEAVSLAACDAVLDLWDENCVKHIWQIGNALMAGLHEAGYELIGNAPRMLIQFPSPSYKAYFTLGMRDRGILWNRPTLPNLAHSLADVERTVKAASEIKTEMDDMDVEAAMKDRLPMVLFENR